MSDEMFKYEFRQLAVYENGRTPVLLNEEQYRRARACVNACAGLDTDTLEHTRLVDALNNACEHTTKQRDDLLSDVERCYKMLLSEPDTRGALFKAENILREAIARVKGGAA